MKSLIIAASITLCIACIGSAVATEKHVVNRHDGFAIMAIVAHTPAEFVKAQREANRWEARRHLSLMPLSIAAVAIDASSEVAATPTQPIRLDAPVAGTAVADVLSQ